MAETVTSLFGGHAAEIFVKFCRPPFVSGVVEAWMVLYKRRPANTQIATIVTWLSPTQDLGEAEWERCHGRGRSGGRSVPIDGLDARLHVVAV